MKLRHSHVKSRQFLLKNATFSMKLRRFLWNCDDCMWNRYLWQRTRRISTATVEVETGKLPHRFLQHQNEFIHALDWTTNTQTSNASVTWKILRLCTYRVLLMLLHATINIAMNKPTIRWPFVYVEASIFWSILQVDLYTAIKIR